MKHGKKTGWNSVEDYGATMPVNGAGGSGRMEETAPADRFKGLGDTLPPSGFCDGEEKTHNFNEHRAGADVYGDVTMPMGAFRGEQKLVPVVGWLVCIEGADRGNDYRIRIGYNQIGRGENMDICIRGDVQISREKHALIAYDDKEKVFFFGPSEGRNIVRLNGKLVMIPTQLQPYDILTIGESRLIFVPLCGEHFEWDD